MENSGFTGIAAFRKQSRDHLEGSQELYSIHHLFRCNNFRVKRQPPNTFTQSQPMHLHENYTAVVLPLAVDLGRYLDQVGVMRKYYGSKLARMLQLSFVTYAAFVLVIDGNCLDSPAAQSYSDPHVYISIGVDF